MFKASYKKPVMAVLVSPLTIRNLRRQKVNPRIKQMAAANEEVKNTLYYFSLKHVDLNQRRITGCYWDSESSRWLPGRFPIPDILYLRGGIKEKHAHIFAELYGMVNERGQIINHPRFNKWELYQVLNKDPVIKNYLPATREVNQPEDIKDMLEKYGVIYLKSYLGRKGHYTLRVEALPDSRYRYSYQKKSKLSTYEASSFQSLFNAAEGFFRGKSFLAQQSIDLIKYENRLVDMRAELQRNGNGQLEIVGICVRLGQIGSPITTHSNAFKFEDYFLNKMNWPKEKVEALIDTVQSFLFRIYEYIEGHYGKYVEIGIDFAVDNDDKIWLIEANSQSTKVSLEKAYSGAVVSRAYKNILEYAGYLYRQTH